LSPSVTQELSNFIDDEQLKKKFAVKVIRATDEELMEVAYEEYKVLRTLDHPNIVKMHDAFFNQMKETMYLVMDLVQGYSLKTLLEDKKVKLTENEIRYIF
jgi:serine/threonine protein kinase